MTEPDAQILSLERREGTYFYKDDQLKGQQFPIVSHISITTFMTPEGISRQHWRQHGLLANMAESIAAYLMANPGMKEAVDGMYIFLARRKLGG